MSGYSTLPWIGTQHHWERNWEYFEWFRTHWWCNKAVWLCGLLTSLSYIIRLLTSRRAKT